LKSADLYNDSAVFLKTFGLSGRWDKSTSSSGNTRFECCSLALSYGDCCGFCFVRQFTGTVKSGRLHFTTATANNVDNQSCGFPREKRS